MTRWGNVNICPVTKKAWYARAKAKSGDCGGQSVYHCLDDNEGRKWERCVEKSLVKEGFCPIFTNEGFIDWKLCNRSISICPNISYFSNDVYKYPRCFGNNSLHEQTAVDHENAERIIAVVIGTVLCLIMLALILAFWFFYKRRRNFNSHFEENVELEILLSGEMSYTFEKELDVTNGTALLLRDEDPEIIVKHCNVDAILQLVRPKGFQSSYFEVAANDKCVTLFKKRIRQLGKEEEYANNPLVAKGTRTYVTKEAESWQIQLDMDHGS